jgi:hypothetical protein
MVGEVPGLNVFGVERSITVCIFPCSKKFVGKTSWAGKKIQNGFRRGGLVERAVRCRVPRVQILPESPLFSGFSAENKMKIYLTVIEFLK